MAAYPHSGHFRRPINVVNHAPAGAVFSMCPAILFLHSGHFIPRHNQPNETRNDPTKEKLKVISSGTTERAAFGLFTRHTNRAKRKTPSTVDSKNITTFHICFVLLSHDEFKRFYRAFPFVFGTGGRILLMPRTIET